MKNNIKHYTMRKLLLILVLSFFLHGMKGQNIIKPSVKTPTSFAIIIDEQSYSNVAEAVKAYRQSVEDDGLGTYLAIGKWKKPEEIRNLLISWYSDKKQPLEGVVFVGDIPIPMIRDAQYLTSAFKMNQKTDWKESSVPSDRYYDDFGLKFRFIKQDKDVPLYFYYSLTSDSRQYLAPDIYSARIKPLELDGVDKYKLLADYLYKVARLKREESNNVLDNLTMARGHSYNSEDRLAWAGEQMALKEQMPQLFRKQSTVKFYDFDMMYPAKNIYLNETMNPKLDVLLFHHHGAPDTQYLNGNPKVSNINPSIDNIKLYLHDKVLKASKRLGQDSAVIAYSREYDVPESWCREAFDSVIQKRDSIFDAQQNVYTTDIHPLNTNARFVLFDACYNGSFYEKDNIAGAYIFNAGKTIATIGGTVNALQDKWPDEFVGLLSAGVRVGQFNRFSGYLESHLIGDPTWRFKNNSSFNGDINESITLHYKDVKYWKKLLNSSMPDVQAMALRQLWFAKEKNLPELLRQKYEQSDNFVVRMEASRLLTLYFPEESIYVLKQGLNDSYELIRRFSAINSERNGSPEFIPNIVSAYLERGHEQRFSFQLISNVKAFDSKKLLSELNDKANQREYYSKVIVEELSDAIKKIDSQNKETLHDLMDKSQKITRRQNTALRFRNYPQAQFIDSLLQIASDETEDVELRTTCINVLGWYDTHYLRHDIISGLLKIKSSSDVLKDEIKRSIARLDKN